MASPNSEDMEINVVDVTPVPSPGQQPPRRPQRSPTPPLPTSVIIDEGAKGEEALGIIVNDENHITARYGIPPDLDQFTTPELFAMSNRLQFSVDIMNAFLYAHPRCSDNARNFLSRLTDGFLNQIAKIHQREVEYYNLYISYVYSRFIYEFSKNPNTPVPKWDYVKNLPSLALRFPNYNLVEQLWKEQETKFEATYNERRDRMENMLRLCEQLCPDSDLHKIFIRIRMPAFESLPQPKTIPVMTGGPLIHPNPRPVFDPRTLHNPKQLARELGFFSNPETSAFRKPARTSGGGSDLPGPSGLQQDLPGPSGLQQDLPGPSGLQKQRSTSSMEPTGILPRPMATATSRPSRTGPRGSHKTSGPSQDTSMKPRGSSRSSSRGRPPVPSGSSTSGTRTSALPQNALQEFPFPPHTALPISELTNFSDIPASALAGIQALNEQMANLQAPGSPVVSANPLSQPGSSTSGFRPPQIPKDPPTPSKR